MSPPPLSYKDANPARRLAFAARYAGDPQLVEAILNGEREAAGVLYDRLRPVVEHALRRVLRSRSADFDDLVQITFERVIGSLAQGRFHGRSSLTTWVAAIAAHVALDALRRRMRENRIFQDGTPNSWETPRGPTHATERRLEARIEIRRLHAVLSRMKPNLAATLILHDVFGHELAEVAEQTGVGLSTAQSRLSRARKELLRRSAAAVSQRGEDE